MRQFIISRQKKTWGTQYAVKDFKTDETILCALHGGVWKSRIDAFKADGALQFTMKCRDLFGLTYDVANADESIMGMVNCESWHSSLLQVTDTASKQTARIARVSPSLYEEFNLSLDGQSICLFRKADSYSNPLICCCLDDSQVSLNLMLSAGILLLGQGPAAAGGGAA